MLGLLSAYVDKSLVTLEMWECYITLICMILKLILTWSVGYVSPAEEGAII